MTDLTSYENGVAAAEAAITRVAMDLGEAASDHAYAKAAIDAYRATPGTNPINDAAIDRIHELEDEAQQARDRIKELEDEIYPLHELADKRLLRIDALESECVDLERLRERDQTIHAAVVKENCARIMELYDENRRLTARITELDSENERQYEAWSKLEDDWHANHARQTARIKELVEENCALDEENDRLRRALRDA